MTAPFSLVVIIPCYNHGHLIQNVLTALTPFKLPIIIVDDGSTSESKQALAQAVLPPQTTVLYHEQNGGKGKAVSTALQKAHDLGFTHALQVDADGQHCLEDIPKFCTLSQSNPNCIISGQPIYSDDIPKGRLYGRKITNFWVYIETLSFEIKESMCGFRVYPVDNTLNNILKYQICQRMEFDTEVLVRHYWQFGAHSILYIPTRVSYPEHGYSNFRMWHDNVALSAMHTKLCFGMLLRLPRLIKAKFNPTQAPTCIKVTSSTTKPDSQDKESQDVHDKDTINQDVLNKNANAAKDETQEYLNNQERPCQTSQDWQPLTSCQEQASSKDASSKQLTPRASTVYASEKSVPVNHGLQVPDSSAKQLVNSEDHWVKQKEVRGLTGLKLTLWLQRLLGRKLSQLLVYPIIGFYYPFATKQRKCSHDFLTQATAFHARRSYAVHPQAVDNSFEYQQVQALQLDVSFLSYEQGTSKDVESSSKNSTDKSAAKLTNTSTDKSVLNSAVTSIENRALHITEEYSGKSSDKSSYKMTENKSELDSKTEPELESNGELESKTEPELDGKPESGSKTKREIECKLEANSDTLLSLQEPTQTKAQSTAQTNAQAQSQARLSTKSSVTAPAPKPAATASLYVDAQAYCQALNLAVPFSFMHFCHFASAILDKFSAWQDRLELGKDVVFAKNAAQLIQRYQNQGCILMTSHLGNMDVARAMSSMHSTITINALVYESNAPAFKQVLEKFAPKSRLNLILAEDIGAHTAMMMQEMLDRNEWIAIAGDRLSVHLGHNKQERVVMCDFLGRKAPFAEGPFILAHVLRRPILQMFAIKQQGKYVLYVHEIPVPAKASRNKRHEAVQALAQAYARNLEYYAERYPLEWFNFYDFWHTPNS